MDKSKKLVFDYNNALSISVGARDGISLKDIKSLQKRANSIHKDLQKARKELMGFYNLPYDNKTILKVKKIANRIRSEYENFVVLGIGGSALGQIALNTTFNHLYHNALSNDMRKGTPWTYVIDNSDPELIYALLDSIDLKKSCFNVISKSGSTAETAAAFMIVRDMVAKKCGKKAIAKQIIATTDPEEGDLRKVAIEERMDILEIPQNVGGRFSVLSPSGLLFAGVIGVNIPQLLAGAVFMDKWCSNPNLFKNPAYLNASIHNLADVKKGKKIAVMMPYSNALRDWADWFRQIWAESLGKRYSVSGSVVNVGQTPVKALGATDQHSQIQLYVEGPNNKIITFLQVGNFRKDVVIPKVYKDYESMNYLSGKRMSALINNELLATELALKKNGRPTVKIIFPEISPFTIGQFIFMMEIQTVFAGGLYGVNPLDQPGVEEGKIGTYALMGKKGYEKIKFAIGQGIRKDKKYIM
jgi:glucose-6-phosphate isomerase